MPKQRQNPEKKKLDVDAIFNDPESRRNLVGLFDLLLKMDRRNNPELYGLKKKKRDP
jgi:hypothetical protein